MPALDMPLMLEQRNRRTQSRSGNSKAPGQRRFGFQLVTGPGDPAQDLCA
jgi:hypothetical protein